MTTKPLLDHHASVRFMAKKRMIIDPLIGLLFVCLGYAITETSYFRSNTSFGFLDPFFLLFGWTFIIGGVALLFGELRFTVRSRGQDGSWHISLDENRLRWSVPEHAHGPEREFDVLIEDIEQAEQHIISCVHEDTRWEYWLKLKGQEVFQLFDYSGINLDTLYDTIARSGVPCFDVFITLDRKNTETHRKVQKYETP